MKTILILVPEMAVPAAIIDPRYMFMAVNEFHKNDGKEPPFRVLLIGQSREVRLNEGVVTFRTDALPDEAGQADLILVPALSGNLEKALEANRPLASWIVGQHQRGAEVASLCLGAFLLASTGLMSGKPCSTHWLFANQFRAMFPDVLLMEDRVITEQNGLYSSGGANAYWNLLLHLVEKYTDRATAVLAAKFFVLDMGRTSQSPFSIFKGQKMHGDPDVLLAQDYLESHFSEKIMVDALADRFNIGRRTFERRFKKATHNSPVEYLQRVRVEAAKKQLETGRKTVNEVMYEVGYTDDKAFRSVFGKVTGMSPTEYRGRYGRG